MKNIALLITGFSTI